MSASHANDPPDHRQPRHGVPMKRALTIRNVAKGAGAVVLGLVALDLVATIVTIVVGAKFLKP